MEIKNTDQIMRADIMVARIQDKNELANAGDIYVGTGNAPDVVDASAGEDGKVANPTVKNIQTAIREDANRQQGLRLGESTSSSYSNIVELGIGAKAEANSACQIGVGTNNVANSLQFRDRTVVNGKGEIVGDYPLGFSVRVMEHPGDNWPMGHADLQGGTLVTDWGFTETNGYKSEVAFVSILDEKADRANLNLVIDGNIYVDDGKRKVYAEGDFINADGLKYISLRDKSDLINADGTTKIRGLCVGFAVNENKVVLDDGHEIPAYSKGIIIGTLSDLVIIYATNNKSGCLYYNATGKDWSNGYPTNAEHATKADLTSFSNGFQTLRDPLENGTYLFHHYYLGCTFLLYIDKNVGSSKSPVFVCPMNIKANNATQIYKNDKFYVQISTDGKIHLFKENVTISGGEFPTYSSSWTEFSLPSLSDWYFVYNKIT